MYESALASMYQKPHLHAEIPQSIRLTSSLLAELIITCLKELSEPLVTSKLSGDLLTHLRAASEGHVKLYVVKCLLEELPEQQHGKHLLLLSSPQWFVDVRTLKVQTFDEKAFFSTHLTTSLEVMSLHPCCNAA